MSYCLQTLQTVLSGYVTWYRRNRCELSHHIGSDCNRRSALWSTSSNCFVHARTASETTATSTVTVTTSARSRAMTSLPVHSDVCVTQFVIVLTSCQVGRSRSTCCYTCRSLISAVIKILYSSLVWTPDERDPRRISARRFGQKSVQSK